MFASTPSSSRWLSVPPSFTYPTTPVSRLLDPQSSHVAFADPTPPPRPIQKPCRSWGCDAADATEAEARHQLLVRQEGRSCAGRSASGHVLRIAGAVEHLLHARL